MIPFYRRNVTRLLQLSEFLMNGAPSVRAPGGRIDLAASESHVTEPNAGVQSRVETEYFRETPALSPRAARLHGVYSFRVHMRWLAECAQMVPDSARVPR